MKKILKFVFIFIFILLVLVFIGTLTPQFKTVIKNQLEKNISNSLNGKITISKLKGNIYSKLEFKNLVLTSEDKKILKIDKILIDYSLKSLFKKEIRIQDFQITNCDFNLRNEDSIWKNEISKEKNSEQENKEEPKKFGWKVFLDNFELKNSKVAFTKDDLEEEINKINLQLNGFYSSEKFNFELNKFTFDSDYAQLKEFKFNLEKKLKKLNINNFNLATNETKFFIEGNLEDDFKKGNLIFRFSPISFNEVNKILKKPLVKGKPEVKLDVKFFGSDLNLAFYFEDEFVLNAKIYNYIKPGKIIADGNIENLNLSKWLINKDLKSNINCDFKVKAENLKDISANLNFRNS